MAELKGHEGPVWQIVWAHPKFQSVIASASYDRSVIVWKETSQNTWSESYRHTVHDSSVNGISWAPHEFGLILACASSDGTISVVTFRSDATYDNQSPKISAHASGVNAVSWSPAIPAFNSNTISRRFASGGCDNLVCVWRLSDMNEWRKECTLQGHNDWVRDVAWAPSTGGAAGTIASASQDHSVIIWREEGPSNWKKSVIQFESVPWRVSWSVTGNILAVSCDDNSVSLFKEGIGGDWTKIKQEEKETK